MYSEQVAITPIGIIVPKKMKRLQEKLNTRFTVRIHNKYTAFRSVSLFFSIPTHTVYPKFGIKHSNAIVVHNDLGSQHRMSPGAVVNSAFKLSEYQTMVVEDILKKFTGVYGGTTLVMPCGSGKTLTAIDIMTKMGLKATVVVPRAHLKKQWRDEFAIYFKSPPVISEDPDDQDADVFLTTTAMLTRLAKSANTIKLMNRRMLILDEVHHFGAETLNGALSSLAYNYCIGLTATPGRIDGLETLYLPFIGPITEIPYIDSIGYKNKICVHVKTFHDIYIPIHYRKDNAQSINYTRIIEDTVTNKEYNQKVLAIVDGIHKVNPARRMLVLSDRVEHITWLYNMSKLNNTALFTGGIKRGEINKNSDYDVIFATYGVATEGFNVKSLNTLVFATPRKNSTEQLVGRILRKKHNIPALVIDIIPNNRILYYQRVNGRIPGYKKMGASILPEAGTDDEL